METAHYPQLYKIVSGDLDEIRLLKNDLSKKGWSFVKLPGSVIEQTTNLIHPIEEFFKLPQNDKEKYQKDKLWGYNFVNHKQGN